ncbi:MAG TPA: molybdate ABC transporter substrate-binding protein [Terriglobia bacterium]|nr:molybdate ABC transporter substrate-binding protein [Terriglobia bacterium]
MRIWSKIAIAGIVAGFGMMIVAPLARAAEVTVMCSNAIKEVLLELVPQFERTTGNKISVTYDSTTNIQNQIKNGAKPDLVIATDEAIDALIKQGKLAAGSRVDLARSRIGIAVRAGAPKPDIRTPEALKKTLLAAKSIANSKSGISGFHFLSVIERLGIADQVKPKIVEVESGPVGVFIVNGKAEMGLQQMSELMPVAGIEIVGPLPGDLQKVTMFSAGLSSAAKDPAAAKALVKFLSADSALPVIKKKGMEALNH